MTPAGEEHGKRGSVMTLGSNTRSNEAGDLGDFGHIHRADRVLKTHRESYGITLTDTFRELMSGEFQRSAASVGLPDNWPVATQCRDCYKVFVEEVKPRRVGHNKTMAVPTSVSIDSADERSREHFLLEATGRANLLLTLIRVIVALLDLLIIPYEVAWTETTRAESVLSLVFGVLWLVDIVLKFNTITQSDSGGFHYTRRAIARRYLSRSFMIDALFVASDFVAHFYSVKFRLVSMGRLWTLNSWVDSFSDRLYVESHRITAQVIKYLYGFLYYNHFMACIYFVIGQSGATDTGFHWIDWSIANPESEEVFAEIHHTFQYVIVYHWMVSQSTVGNEVVYTSNTYERIFNVFGAFCALLINITLVSILSATLVDYRDARKGQKNKVRELDRFLMENKISQQLAMQLQRQAQQRLNLTEQRLNDTDVSVLRMLSAQLIQDLRLELYSRHLVRSPLLALWNTMENRGIAKLCNDGVEFVFLLPEEELFRPGQSSSAAYYLVSGSMAYSQHPDTSLVPHAAICGVDQHHWLCEATLWVEWYHVGVAEASRACQLLSLSTSAIPSVSERLQVLKDITRAYAQAFWSRVITATPPFAPWPNDLEVAFTEFGELVMSMDDSLQNVINMEVLEHVAKSRTGFMHSRGSSQHALDKLTQEVEDGKCVLILTPDGEAQRIVSVVALKVRNDYQEIFMQIAKIEESGLSTGVQLPGCKQDRGELPKHAMERLLNGQLNMLKGNVQTDNAYREVMCNISKDIGVNTKYLKTIFGSRLTSPLETTAESDRPVYCPVSERVRAAPTTSTVDSGFEKVAEKEVYKYTFKGKTYCYAWISPAEEKMFSGAAGDALLRRWLRLWHFREPRMLGGQSSNDRVHREMETVDSEREEMMMSSSTTDKEIIM